MKPSQIDNRQEDIFRGRLSNELNPKHEMMILARMIPWDSLESEFSDLYQSIPHLSLASEIGLELVEWRKFFL